jgi:hypothetical protein
MQEIRRIICGSYASTAGAVETLAPECVAGALSTATGAAKPREAEWAGPGAEGEQRGCQDLLRDGLGLDVVFTAGDSCKTATNPNAKYLQALSAGGNDTIGAGMSALAHHKLQ